MQKVIEVTGEPADARVTTTRGTHSYQDVMDADLPPENRTQANYWRAQYLQAVLELQKANKGLRRLAYGRDKLKRQFNKLHDCLRFGAEPSIKQQGVWQHIRNTNPTTHDGEWEGAQREEKL